MRALASRTAPPRPLLSLLRQYSAIPVSDAPPPSHAQQPSVADALATKKFYVSTPIFYVNGPPHIGHAYTAVLADAIARFRRLDGRRVHFVTGTDEHGAKVEEAARKAGAVDTRAHCDHVSQQFRDLFTQLGVSYTDFVRTTEARHTEAVTFIWQRLEQQRQLYLGQHEGWYCRADETFVPETQLATVQRNGVPVKVVAESGHAVEWISEPNYKFRLAAHREFLMRLLARDDFIVPKQRAEDMRHQIGDRDTLDDLSVSRSSARSAWGIPVPRDASQTVYVWLDALTNYLTAAGYPNPMRAMRAHAWPADVHVIGKDIARFHTIYWPAFLAAADLPLPKQVLIHGHFTVNRVKMSKSLNNVVDPMPLARRFGACALRYFLLAEARAEADADFSLDALASRRQAQLADTLGNLLSRATNAKLIPNGTLPAPTAFDLAVDVSLLQLMRAAPSRVHAAYAQHEMRRAIESVFEVLYAANKYVQDARPWTLGTGDARQAARRDTVMYIVLEALRMCAIMLQPIVPSACATLLDRIGVPADRRLWMHLELPIALEFEATDAHSQGQGAEAASPASGLAAQCTRVTHDAAIAARVGFVPNEARVSTSSSLSVLFPKLVDDVVATATGSDGVAVIAAEAQRRREEKAAQKAAQRERSMRGQQKAQTANKSL